VKACGIGRSKYKNLKLKKEEEEEEEEEEEGLKELLLSYLLITCVGLWCFPCRVGEFKIT